MIETFSQKQVIYNQRYSYQSRVYITNHLSIQVRPQLLVLVTNDSNVTQPYCAALVVVESDINIQVNIRLWILFNIFPERKKRMLHLNCMLNFQAIFNLQVLWCYPSIYGKWQLICIKRIDCYLCCSCRKSVNQKWKNLNWKRNKHLNNWEVSPVNLLYIWQKFSYCIQRFTSKLPFEQLIIKKWERQARMLKKVCVN